MDKKIIKKLEKIWDRLDNAYEDMENAFEMLESIDDIPEELQREIDNFDLSAISSLKQHIEMLIDKMEV